jgi:hypothetical protein
MAVYNVTDPNGWAGVIEVIHVIEAGSVCARIATRSAGVKPEFSDLVGVE